MSSQAQNSQDCLNTREQAQKLVAEVREQTNQRVLKIEDDLNRSTALTKQEANGNLE
jgi:hypothetical protein